MPSVRNWLRLALFLLIWLPGLSVGAAQASQPADAPATGIRFDLAAPEVVTTVDAYRLAIHGFLVYRFADEARFRLAIADTQALQRRLSVLTTRSSRRVIGNVAARDLGGPGIDQVAARIAERIKQDSRRFGIEIVEFGFLSISRVVPP